MKKGFFIAIPGIILVIFVILIIQEPTDTFDKNMVFLEILDFSVISSQPNTQLYALTSANIPNEVNFQVSDGQPLAVGYFWFQNVQENPDKFKGIFANIHSIYNEIGTGWHSEIANAITSSQNEIDFCLELQEISSDIRISQNTVTVIVPSDKFNFKDKQPIELLTMKTLHSTSCNSQIGAKVLEP